MDIAQLICEFRPAHLILNPLGRGRAQHFYRHTKDLFAGQNTVLDLGCGLGHLSQLLIQKGLRVTSVDIKNLCIVDRLKPLIYDGRHLPFPDRHFDLALISTVLHHTPHPERVISEAARVSRRLIIIEEIYHHPLQRYLTFFFDSLSNLDFTHHPHTNKTDAQWRQLFKILHLDVQKASYFTSYIIFQSVAYLLTPTSS